MFGTLIDDVSGGWPRGRLARFASRSFRDVDWGAAVAATINLTAGIVGAVVKNQQTNTQNQQNAAQYQCPAGYVYDTNTRLCQPQQSSVASFLTNVDPVVLGIGGVALLLLLTRGGRD